MPKLKNEYLYELRDGDILRDELENLEIPIFVQDSKLAK